MRVEYFGGGVVDDLVVEAASEQIRRTGDARYRIDVTGEASLAIELWSTRRSHLRVAPFESPPEWVLVALGPGEELEKLDATDCQLHLESMSRRSYWLGLSRGSDYWSLTFLSPAFAKARIAPANRAAG